MEFYAITNCDAQSREYWSGEFIRSGLKQLSKLLNAWASIKMPSDQNEGLKKMAPFKRIRSRIEQTLIRTYCLELADQSRTSRCIRWGLIWNVWYQNLVLMLIMAVCKPLAWREPYWQVIYHAVCTKHDSDFCECSQSGSFSELPAPSTWIPIDSSSEPQKTLMPHLCFPFRKPKFMAPPRNSIKSFSERRFVKISQFWHAC